MDAMTAWPEPVPFLDPEETIGSLDPKVIARLIAAAGDVTLVLDADGVIRDMSVGSPDLSGDGAVDWLGKPWIETVTRESRVKVAEMLEDRTRPRRWRQVNQIVRGLEVPVRYMAIEVRADGGMVAVGRDMRATAALQQRVIQAQQAMERDHLRLRQAETRYRMLFDLAGEAMLILDGDTRRVLEANSAAETLAGLGRLVGQPFSGLAQERDREVAITALGAASAVDRAAPTEVRLAANGRRVRLTVSAFRQGRASYYLVRIAPVEDAHGRGPSAAILEQVPDPFVLTDEQMNVIAANTAFLEATDHARPEDVQGRPLAQFLGRPGIDGPLMAAQLREHGSLRKFATVLYGRFGAQDEVEVSAVVAPDGERQCFGFTLRTVPLRREVPVTGLESPDSIERLTQLVGRMSLKDIVRESTDLIERLCIEAALRYTSDNRASAAEILGLSRQGLYSKLNRHGLSRGAADDES